MPVPTHAVVDIPGSGPFGWNEATWVAINAIVASLVAMATGILAWFTRRLAGQTRDMAVETRDLVKAAADERQQIERHHQQAMMPIVHIEANCSMVVSNEKIWIVLQGDLVNIGAGPCTGINILIKPLGFMERISYQGLLGANSRRHFKIEWQLSGPVPFQQQLPHDCITRFATIFSTEGAIHQRSHSGLAKDSIVQNYVSPTDEDARKKITDMIGTLGVSSSPIPT